MAASDSWIVSVDRHPPVGQMAATMLRERFDTVWVELHAVCARSEYAEHVHNLRVATRRTLAAVDAFRSVIPAQRRKWFEKKLRQLRRAAGEARDLDVLSNCLAKNDAVRARGRLVAILAHRRRTSRVPIRAQLKKLTEAGWSARVNRLLEDVYGRRPLTGFRSFARRRFKPMVASFVETADRALRDNDDIHSLRIEGKKLRYTMEIFAAAFPAGMLRRCQKSLERLQTTLGECTDHASAADRLCRWSRCPDAGPNRGMLVSLSDDENEKADRARKAFRKWWNPTRRRSLRRRLDRTIRHSA